MSETRTPDTLVERLLKAAVTIEGHCIHSAPVPPDCCWATKDAATLREAATTLEAHAQAANQFARGEISAGKLLTVGDDLPAAVRALTAERDRLRAALQLISDSDPRFAYQPALAQRMIAEASAVLSSQAPVDVPTLGDA